MDILKIKIRTVSNRIDIREIIYALFTVSYVMLCSLIPGEKVLPEKLGEGAVAASQNPCTLYDQNLQFSLPYLRPDQKSNTLFMAVAACTVALSIILEALLSMVLSIPVMMK